MKKIICLLILLCSLALTSCNYMDTAEESFRGMDCYFVLDEYTTNNTVVCTIVDKETNVMYMFVKLANGGGITPLYNQDGTLKIYGGEDAMRTILFKAKIIDANEWVEGYYAKSGDRHYILIDNDFAVGYVKMKEVQFDTICEFTNLTDKNGKRIFEGDLIDTPDRILKVVWLKGNAQFDLEFVKHAHDKFITNFKGIEPRDLSEYEVIGNIHDNKEML